jgi:hypothetical protein
MTNTERMRLTQRLRSGHDEPADQGPPYRAAVPEPSERRARELERLAKEHGYRDDEHR